MFIWMSSTRSFERQSRNRSVPPIANSIAPDIVRGSGMWSMGSFLPVHWVIITMETIMSSRNITYATVISAMCCTLRAVFDFIRSSAYRAYERNASAALEVVVVT
uniref:(northern house mosquito) hypothetical protein n=1 Tax=Culex pipiens TaxID=7175 RepID=A0A8D8E286_CULPI